MTVAGRARRPTPSAWRLAIGATVLAVLAAGCASGERTVDTGARPDLPPSAEAATSPLPPVAVWDVGDSDWVQFADLLPSDKPLLVWFWAPHCPACAGEAPDMVAFAEEHGDVVDIVGLGTQDTAGEAATFVGRHGIPFPMLWDESFETWRAFGITSQPAVALFSAEGDLLGGWLGAMPEDEVLSLVT